MIQNASKIVDEPSSFTLDRFFDLSSFIEAFVLFDSVSYIESSNLIPRYELSRAAHADGVLQPMSPKFGPDECKRIVDAYPDFVTSLSSYTFWELDEEPGSKPPLHIYQTDDLRPMARIISPDSLKGNTCYDGSCNYYYTVRANIPLPEVFVTAEQSLAKQLEWLNYLRFYPSIPDGVRASAFYIRRTFGYILIAALNEVDYFPDSIRVPHAMAHLDRSLKAKLKAIGRKKALFEELSRKHEEHEVISLKEGLTYAETLSKTIHVQNWPTDGADHRTARVRPVRP